MRVALMIPPDYPLAGVPAIAAGAEDAGFDLLACGEHLFFHGPTPNTFISLAAAAGATERVRLLSALTIVPVYPVGVLAKLVAALDQVSGGRFDLGVGVGGEYPPEFVAAGVDVTQRGARTDEALEVLRPLLAGETVTHHGRFADIPGLALQPPAVQQPGPPVWVGGRKGAAIRRAARYGDVWMPYMFTPQQVADSLTEVNKQAAEHGRGDSAVRGAVFVWGAVDADAAVARQSAIDVVSTIYNQDFAPLADRYLLHGDPANVIARLREYHEAGVDNLLFSAAARSDDERTAVQRLFADEVLPEVQSWT
jgi:probable F420-dependent oxidoreductase